tara:strand:+ start:5069 stop:5770 length:702 start_codon:yes stop_codon:yes gene_type:complete
VGSLYGEVIDLKPGVVLRPSMTGPSVPKTAATDLSLTSSNYFDVNFVLNKYNLDPEKDPDLKAQGIIEEGSQEYTLRIRVKNLLDFVERKALVTQIVDALDQNGNNTNFRSLVRPVKNRRGEHENGYQCGSPQSSWYQVTFVLDQKKFNDDEGRFESDYEADETGLDGLIKEAMQRAFELSAPAAQSSQGEELQANLPIKNDSKRYRYAILSMPENSQSKARDRVVRVTRLSA